MVCFAGNWFSLIAHIGLIGKFVLLVLLVLFIAAFAVFINRYVILREHNMHLQGALEAIKEVKTVDDLFALGLSLRGSYPGVILKRVATCAKDALAARTGGDGGVSADTFALLSSGTDQTLLELVAEAEEYMPFFSLVAGIAPLLGLLGTVLGLINAFVGISRLQSASIAVIAPGVAEALVTTFAGLLVAISGIMFYQLAQSRVRMLERRLYVFTDQVEYMVKKVLL